MSDESLSLQGLKEAGLDLLPRVAVFGVGAWLASRGYSRMVEHVADRAASGELTFWLQVAQETSFMLYALIACVLAFIRLKPVGKAAGVFPRFAALTGTFGLTLLGPESGAAPDIVRIASVLFLLVGNTCTAVSIYYLGRSFSIMPEARRLVDKGPYGIVRHPLYVSEFLAMVGMVLMHFTPRAAVVGLVQTAFQFSRSGFEEGVLRRAFPEYDEYARRVPRFVPFTKPRA